MNDKPAEKLNNDSLNGRPESASGFDGLGAELEKNLSRAVKAEMDDMTEQEMVEIYENSNTLKGMVAKRKKELTDEHEEQRRKKKVMAFKLGTVVCLLGVIMIFASIAWFTMNREVGTGGMSMKTTDMPFELKISQSDHDIAENDYNEYIEQLNYDTQKIITGEKNSIRFVLKDESTNNNADSLGIKPGSFGSLTFYIVPKDSIDLVIDFKIEITGYYAEFDENDDKMIKSGSFVTLADKAKNPEAGETEETSKYTKAANFIKGHIILFDEYNFLSEEELGGTVDTSKYFNNRIDGSFTYDTSLHPDDFVTVDGVDCYKIDIFWIWPNTFGQILFDKNNKNLYDSAMFSSLQTENPRSELIEYISENKSLFFMSRILADKTSVELGNMMSADALSNTDALITLSNGYNSADQIIGENVRFILAEIQTTGYQ